VAWSHFAIAKVRGVVFSLKYFAKALGESLLFYVMEALQINILNTYYVLVLVAHTDFFEPRGAIL
jgi:hypothetical protein